MSLIHANSATAALYCELFFVLLSFFRALKWNYFSLSVCLISAPVSLVLPVYLARVEAWSPAPAAGKSAVRLVIQSLLTRVACPNWAKFNTAHPWVPGNTQVWRILYKVFLLSSSFYLFSVFYHPASLNWSIRLFEKETKAVVRPSVPPTLKASTHSVLNLLIPGLLLWRPEAVQRLQAQWQTCWQT